MIDGPHGPNRRCAISVYVSATIIKKQLSLTACMYKNMQVLSVTLFEKTLLESLLSADLCKSLKGDLRNQFYCSSFNATVVNNHMGFAGSFVDFFKRELVMVRVDCDCVAV